MIHQHFKLVDVLTAAENIVLGLKEPGRLDLDKVSEKIRSICDAYGFEVDPRQKVYDMSVSQKQTVEIIKVLYRGADILILDEPTAVLTPQETDKLFAVLRNMRDAGKAIVIITHKMHEVEALSDRVAILRHGQFIGDMPTKNTNAQEMTNMMVGHTVSLNIDRPEPKDPKPRIDVKNLTVRSIDGILKLDDVSFTANSGRYSASRASPAAVRRSCSRPSRIAAHRGGSIAYVDDNGDREELLGKDRWPSRRWAWPGPPLSRRQTWPMVQWKHGSLRKHDAPLLPAGQRNSLPAASRRRQLARRSYMTFEVNTPDVDSPVRKLSGGNVHEGAGRPRDCPAPTVLLRLMLSLRLDINLFLLLYNSDKPPEGGGARIIYVGEDLDVLLELFDKDTCALRRQRSANSRGAGREEARGSA